MNISSKKKILHRAKYRGIKELDIIFEKFVNTYKYKLNDQEFKELEEILNLPDNLLLDIILKKEKVPANYDNPVMKKIFKTCNDKSSE
jgi:succinate dehydrogenase flavin-adding protein (antitoxin of CptAB toxin-antitoxin module)